MNLSPSLLLFVSEFVMYKSKKQIENKIRQVNFVNNEIQKFRGRVFVNDGVDPETGAHPLITHVSSFLAHARSVVQYAYKEAKEAGKLSEYERYVQGVKIFKLFKDVRDCDIHEFTIGVHQIMQATATFDPATMKNGVLESKPITIFVEDISNLNSHKKEKSDVRTVYTLRKRVSVTNELIQELKDQGQTDILKAISEDKEIYDEQEIDGINNLHVLCDIYIDEINKFIEYGEKSGFIS